MSGKIITKYVAVVNWLSRLISSNNSTPRIFDLQVQLCFLQVAPAVITLSIVATALGFLFYDTAGIQLTLTWVLSVYLLTAIRLFSVHQYKISRQADPTKMDNRFWYVLSISFSTIAGLQWGTAALLFFNLESMMDISILVLLELGIIAAAVASLSVIPAAYVGFATPIALMTVYPLLFTENSDFSILAILIIVYLLAMYVFCKNFYKTTLFGMRMSIENSDLVESLQIEKNRTEMANHAKSRFFTNVTHEFRTPLTLTIGPLQALIKSAGINDPGDKHYLKIALDNCHKMLGLVGQILDVNRLESGEMQATVSQFDLGEKLHSYLEKYQLLAKQHQIILSSKNLDAGINIYFDQDHLDKIINNLLSNAFKFSPKNTQIELGMSLHTNADQVDIWVKDEGPGISEEDKAQLFDRYFQGKVISNLQPGTGIGLALVKELLDLHSASIELDEGYHKGALFKVTLNLGNQHYQPEQFIDLLAPTTSALPAVSQQNQEPESQKIDQTTFPTVLVVDDNRDLRYFIRTSLQSSYNIIEAVNGREALEWVKTERPDFIISDIMMPVMDGLELVQTLKQDPELADIPLLLLTAKTTKIDTVQGLQLGANDYLGKPFDSSELIARIDSHLAQKKNIARSIYRSFKQQTVSQSNQSTTRPMNAFAAKFSALIDEHLADPDFSVVSMVSHLGIERSTLFRKVKNSFNSTPGQYLKDRRLQLSRQMFDQKSGSVSEIAYAVGFQSLSYFSRSFSEAFNISPTQYQKL